MRRSLLAATAAVICLAQPAAAAAPEVDVSSLDPALVQLVRDWVQTVGADIAPILRDYGTSCFLEAFVAMPAEAQALILARGDIDEGIQATASLPPEVYGRVFPRIDACGGLVAIGTMAGYQIDADFPAEPDELRTGRLDCLLGVIDAMTTDSLRTIFDSPDFSSGVAVLVTEDATTGPEIRARVDACMAADFVAPPVVPVEPAPAVAPVTP